MPALLVVASAIGFEARVKANSSATNIIGVRTDSGAGYYEIILSQAGTVAAQGSNAVLVGANDWRSYRIIVENDPAYFDLYVDGVLKIDNALKSTPSTPTTGPGRSLVKLGAEKADYCNMDVKHVKNAFSVLIPVQDDDVGDTWLNEYFFGPNWKTSGWRALKCGNNTEATLIAQSDTYASVKDTATNGYGWLTSPDGYNLPSGAFTLEASLKVAQRKPKTNSP